MGQVTVTLNGRTYSLMCADGEEPRLLDLAGIVKTRADALAEETGAAGDDSVLLLAAMMIAEELLQTLSGPRPHPSPSVVLQMRPRHRPG